MKEIIQINLEKWMQYWGDGNYQWLFIAALLYLVIFKRKKEYVKNVLFYVFFVLVLFWFPVTAVIVQKCIEEEVYWRVLWLLLNVPVCSLAIVELVKDKKRICKFLLVVLSLGIIAVSGKSVLEANVYETAHNHQKIPYDIAVICNIVKEHAGDTEVWLAADEYIATYVRVYDASISMPYGRDKHGSWKKICKKLYNEICSGEKDYELIADYAKELNCNYVVCCVTDENGYFIMEENGYQVIDTMNQYTIFCYKN